MLDGINKTLKEKIEESLSKLLQFKRIDQNEYDILLNHYLSRNDEEIVLDELYNMFTETNFIRQKLFDIENFKTYDVGNMNGEYGDMSISNIPSYSINNMDDFEIDIIDVNDGAESEFTGVIPIGDKKDFFDETNDVNESQSFGKQKTLGSHPGVGSHFHWGDDGFTTLLLIMFLTGISVGIVSMMVLNFIA